MAQGGSRTAALAAALVGTAFIAALATGSTVYWRSAQEIRASTEDKFSALMQVRGAELEDYLVSVLEEARFWNKNQIMREALSAFSEAFHALGPEAERYLQRVYIQENPYPEGARDNLEFAADGSRYSEVHARYHYWLRSFLLHRGIYDVFLFDPEGALVYTSLKEQDFATNLVTGPWRDTDLGRAFRAARDNPFPSYVAFFDFARYAPSHGAPAGFFSSPVLADDGSLLGVLAFQIPSDRINRIMQATAGMGESGETYVVGEDLLMRSDSRFSEESTTLKTSVDTTPVGLALQGETGLQTVPDYRQIPVLSAYGPLEFEGVRWAVMAEIDEAEIDAPLADIRSALVGGAVVAGILAGFVGLLLMRRLTRA